MNAYDRRPTESLPISRRTVIMTSGPGSRRHRWPQLVHELFDRPGKRAFSCKHG
jgi:hypothetical protein